MSSAIAAFFDGVAPAAAPDGGAGAAPPAADAAPGFGGGGGCAVVGDLGWDLTADLESAVAICGWESGECGGVDGGRSGNGEVRFELVGAGFGCQSGAFGGEFEVDLGRFWMDRWVSDSVFELFGNGGDEISTWERMGETGAEESAKKGFKIL